MLSKKLQDASHKLALQTLCGANIIKNEHNL